MNAIDYLMSLENRGVKFGLNNIRHLLDAAGNPHKRYATIHIAGTNGKGSVLSFIGSALRAAGLHVGLYSSPHLVRFNERIVVDGAEIPDDALVQLAERFRPIADGMADGIEREVPTFFEFSTAIAFAYFAEREVDYAIVETGLGGRLDSTNVLVPECAVITNLSIDHTEYLGTTLESIAREKAGIVNGSGPVVTAVSQPEALEIIERRCRSRNVELYRCGTDFTYTIRPHEFPRQEVAVATPIGDLELTVQMAGRHQAENAAVAAMVCKLLQRKRIPALSDEFIRAGFETARWPGRLDVVRDKPFTILDAAHNPAGARVLRETLADAFPGRPIVLVMGISRDKDADAMARELCPMARDVIVTRYRMHRAMPVDRLLAAVRRYAPRARGVSSVGESISAADELAGADDMIVVAGSIFTVGDAIAHFAERPDEVPVT